MFVRPMPKGDPRRDPSQDTESSEEPSSAPKAKPRLETKAKAKAPLPPSPLGSTSSYELVTEEEDLEVPESRKPKTPTTPDVESSEEGRRRDKKETYHGRGRSPVKSASGPKGPRSANPKASSVGKPAEEHVKRRFCWRRIRACASARAQHEYWNLNCLRWQFRNEGHSWGEACRMALACKSRREEEDGSPPRAAAPAKVKNPAPVLKEAKEKRKVHKEKSKKEKRLPKHPKRRRRRPRPSANDWSRRAPQLLCARSFESRHPRRALTAETDLRRRGERRETLHAHLSSVCQGKRTGAGQRRRHVSDWIYI